MTHCHHLVMVCNLSKTGVFCGLWFNLVWKDFKRREKKVSVCECQSRTLSDSLVQVLWPGGGFLAPLKGTEDVSVTGAADRDPGRVWTRGLLHNLNLVSATDTTQTHRECYVLIIYYSGVIFLSSLNLDFILNERKLIHKPCNSDRTLSCWQIF